MSEQNRQDQDQNPYLSKKKFPYNKVFKSFLKKTGLPVSVDTYKPEVAKAAMEEGAHIINDIYALQYDRSKMAEVAAKYNAGVILMHMKGTPSTMQKNIKYKDVISDIFNFLHERADFALQNGIKKESIILDPGIGFGKPLKIIIDNKKACGI
jgi:dihydropteroate synthase